MDTATHDALVLFDTSVEGRLETGWAAGVLHQRTKTIKAGPMVYVECFPVWDTARRREAKTEAQKEAHRKAQQRANERNARKKLERLVNANFGAGDIILTMTYPHGKQPGSDEQAHRDLVNYIARMKYLRKRRGLPQMRYITITEVTNSAKYGVRWHHHIIMGGDGITRDEAEACWKKKHGGICNAKLCQPTERHLTGFARYLTLDKRNRTVEGGGNPQGKAMRRGWNPSKNLREPVETVADKKISIRKAGRIAEAAQDFGQMREIFAKLYPGCELLEITAKRSQWAAGVYIYAELRQKSEGGRAHEKRGTMDAGCGKGADACADGKRRAAGADAVGRDEQRQASGCGAAVPHPKRRKPGKGRGGAV